MKIKRNKYRAKSAERLYYKTLRRLLLKIKKVFKTQIQSQLKFLIDSSDVEQRAVVKKDSLADTINELMQQLRQSVDTNTSNVVQKIANVVENSVNQALGLEVETSTGINLLQKFRSAQTQKSFFVASNRDLINKTQNDYIDNIQKVLMQKIPAGGRVTEVLKELAIEDKKALNRAKFVARDQISSFNGNLARATQQDLGISMYQWSTSSDEAVRDSHVVMNDKICRWDNPNVYSADDGKTWEPRPADAVNLQPGEDYQCRCVGVPFFE